ncbi:YkgJ family cysteine cluster protein [Patescibacteria group bacterium]|nr:YkgJ family cysteine cluster protein [Patescibacteria group bacterium]
MTDQEIVTQGDVTEEAFQEAVDQKKRNGLSFVLAVYQTLDEFLEKEKENSGVTLACKKGCSSCCYQLVSCTEMEIDEIVRFIKAMSKLRRRPLERRLKKFATKWQKYFGRNEIALNRDSFKALQDWLGEACPFLNEGGGFCDVYPVRTIDCRTASSLSPCNEGGRGERFLFQSENWANNLILDEQQKRAGKMRVTPIHHWLLIKKF